MEGSYIVIADNYYKYKTRVIYAIDYFKGKILGDVDGEYVTKYGSMLRNLEAAYHNLTKAKADLNLPLHDFNSFTGEGFCIHRGRLYGNIAKAREFADKLILDNQSNSEKEVECNKLYELGLFIKHYGEKIKKDFIAVPDFVKPIAEAAKTSDNAVIPEKKEPAVEKTIKVISDISAPKNSATNGIFNIFAQIGNPSIALGQ